MNDAVFCFPCRFFSKHQEKNTIFVTTGFKNWKKALEKCSGFKQHETSSEHKQCQLIWTEYLQMKSRKITVSSLINKGHLKLVKENQKYIQYIGKALLFTVVQCIAQRGDNESENSLNRGNFVELLHLLEYFNDDFKQKRQSLPKNSKYISPQIQNEIFTIFNQMIRDQISNELQKCQYFAIMVDETKDISKIEQLSVVLIYYLDGIIYERFMGYRAADFLCAKSLFTYIKRITFY